MTDIALINNTTHLSNIGIVLVEPTDKELMSPSLLKGNTLEPYAIESIGAYLLQHGLNNIHIVQQYSSTDEELLQEIIKINPLIVGFSVLSCNYLRAITIASKIKKHLPIVYIVFGGYHPALNIQEVLQNACIDFVVFGEGEITFCELATSIIYKTIDYCQIAGLAYKEGSTIVINKPKYRIDNLDNLPFAIRNKEFLNRSRNWNLSYPSPLKQTAVAQINYSRGCPFQCSFCASPTLWSKTTDSNMSGAITYRSVNNVIDEIKDLKKRFGVNFIYFNDLTMNASDRHLRELCDAIISSGLHNPNFDTDEEADCKNNIHWFCLAKIGLSANMAELMAKAGCSKIGFGIESFYKTGYSEMQKPFKNFTDIKETLEHTDAVGIINRVYIVLGWPNETLKSIEATIEGLLSTKVDQIRVAYFTPFPGTILYTECKEKNILLENDYSEYDGDTPVVKCANITPQELRECRKKIINSFYNNPVYIKRCKDKIQRFPRLHASYKSFANELFGFSNGTINIKDIA